MKRKRYFNEIKKEICLHQLLSKLHNYFSTKSPCTSIHFRQRCTSFWNPSLKKPVFCFWNHFLNADFTSSSQLKRWPFKCSFSFGNRWKSLGARSGLTFFFKTFQEFPRNENSFSFHFIRQHVRYPSGTNILESKNTNDVSHSLLRNS